jgi:predicted Zn-dependent protease
MTNPLDVAAQLVEIVGDRAEAEATVVGGRTGLTRFANSFIHQNVAEEQLALSLRVSLGGRVATRTANRVDAEALRGLADDALEIAALQPVDPEWPGLAAPAAAPDFDHWHAETAAAGPAERAATVAEFVAAGDGMLSAGYCDTADAETAFANSSGQRLTGRSTRATLDGIQRGPDSAGSAHQTSGRFGELDGRSAGALAAERARLGRDAVELEPGEYEVVLGPEAVATMAIFLSVYGFNGKAVAEGRSFVQLGAQQFDDAVCIWDDAPAAGSLGVAFDTEGTPTPRMDLVADGHTVGVVHDRRTAAQAGVASTGHGSPASPTMGPIATDLVVGSGNAAPDALVGGVAHGLYVATFNYCRILDPKSQVITGLTRNGTFLIRNGEIAEGVANLRFTQSFLQALSPGNVLGIGDDQRFADCEFGAGLVRAPSLRLASWRFTGGAAG